MSHWKKYSFSEPLFDTIIKNPVVLGFSAYFHDSSAAIIKNGKVIAAVEEERFSRIKHDGNFPENAIKYCLSEAGVNKVDAVVYFEDPDIKWQRINETLKYNPPPQKIQDEISYLWQHVKNKRSIQKKFESVTRLKNKIVFLDHHLSHAASSYLLSGFNDAAIVTIDGVGEKNTTTWGYGNGRHIDLKQCIEFPNSIGLLYTAITTFLGFKANADEYKVMGLSAYGTKDKKKNRYYSKIKKLINQNDDSSYMLDMKYFGHSGFEELAYTSELIKLLGITPRQKDQPIIHDHEDIAAALQMVTEEVVLKILNYVYSKSQTPNLCLAGGVALNSVLNGKILKSTPFQHLFIQPAAGDNGTALGAAKYIQHLIDPDSPKDRMENAYLGPGFSDAEIKKYLGKQGIPYSTFKSRNLLLSHIASLLEKNKIVGWFQGNMEWGPRALGNRSILASPLDPKMRDNLNEKVKHREMFRPFAPAVCEDDVFDYFDCTEPIPEPSEYMLMVYDVLRSKRHLLPAVTHTDGSARPQVVRRTHNKLFYDLIKEFGKKTGVPVLINTSFNIAGEPIVCTPNDAYKCMMATGIDYLILGKYLIMKDGNMKETRFP